MKNQLLGWIDQASYQVSEDTIAMPLDLFRAIREAIEALEFYANGVNYTYRGGYCSIMYDSGDEATRVINPIREAEE